MTCDGAICCKDSLPSRESDTGLRRRASRTCSHEKNLYFPRCRRQRSEQEIFMQRAWAVPIEGPSRGAIHCGMCTWLGIPWTSARHTTWWDFTSQPQYRLIRRHIATVLAVGSQDPLLEHKTAVVTLGFTEKRSFNTFSAGPEIVAVLSSAVPFHRYLMWHCVFDLAPIVAQRVPTCSSSCASARDGPCAGRRRALVTAVFLIVTVLHEMVVVDDFVVLLFHLNIATRLVFVSSFPSTAVSRCEIDGTHRVPRLSLDTGGRRRRRSPICLDPRTQRIPCLPLVMILPPLRLAPPSEKRRCEGRLH